MAIPTGRECLVAIQTLLRVALSERFVTVYVGAPRSRTNRIPTKGTDMADPVHLQQQQEFDVTITGIKDAAGRDTSFDGPPAWVSSDPAVVDLRVAEDGLSAIVGSLDADGTVTVTITGDARMGPDMVPLIAVLSVIVAPGDVVVFDVSAGEARART